MARAAAFTCIVARRVTGRIPLAAASKPDKCMCNLEITVDGKRASVGASSMIFRAMNGLVFNTHARYDFRLSK